MGRFLLSGNSYQIKVQSTSFHHLAKKSLLSSKKTSISSKKSLISSKTLTMQSLINFLGMQSSKSYASSGKSQDELTKKASEDSKQMTTDEWHDLLDGQTFNVTREKGTERPWTSCLNDEKRNGTFYCACCTHPLFKSSTKFDSGSGWPSFWDPIKSEEDVKFGMVRVEVLCSKCDAHLGHVFNDGPPPT